MGILLNKLLQIFHAGTFTPLIPTASAVVAVAKQGIRIRLAKIAQIKSRRLEHFDGPLDPERNPTRTPSSDKQKITL